MKISPVTMVKGVAWTVGIFGLSQSLRVVSSMVLTRLLAPELFGILVIVYTLQNGIDLLSDFGFGQSLILNKNAERPKFYNTVWSLRLVRGLLLLPCCIAVAFPFANLYHAAVLAWILPIVGLNFVLGGLASLGIPFLQKRLQTAKLNIFQLIIEAITAATQIIYAYFSPTVWALVLGGLVSSAASAIGSYRLVPELRHKFYISWEYTKDIFSLGKWLFVSSTIFFLSYSFDNLYFGKVIPIELLGVYGIARTITEAVSGLVGRINSMVIFPFIASHSELPRADLRQQLKAVRARFLIVAALGFSLLVANADLLIRVLYDRRYQEAGWMLSVMLIGKWISTLSYINEATLIGFARTRYGAYSFGLKFVVLLIGLPLAFMEYGIVGAIIFVVISEIFRYVPLLIGQTQERFSFLGQDVVLTSLMLALIMLGEWLRYALGLGTSFDGLLFARVPH
jgi:O-antigen/teichoic acid export membrane protein